MKQLNEYDLIIIGAGPAGLMTAGLCAKENLRVLILDKNDKTARKLRITGKGRCNLTNNCSAQDFLSAVITNPKFLYASSRAFTAQDTMEFFEKLGVALKTERGNRVFPVSDNANEVADALSDFVMLKKGKILKTTVKDVDFSEGLYCVKTQSESFYGKNLLIATGGVSYPVTGSSGDGYKFAKKLGHSIIAPRASLSALVSSDTFCADMQGLSLKNCAIKLVDNTTNKTIYEDFGEMLFTHFGVSGPMILSASTHLKNMDKGRYKIALDLKPALDLKQLDARILRDLEKNAKKNFENSLAELLPQSMIAVILTLSGIDPKKKCSEINKTERKTLVNLLKNFTVNIDDFRPIGEAIVTSGGVNVKEIDPKTMQSKISPNLYFAGEVIDVDAYTGGFNLQIAFSTAYMAATTIINN